MRLRWLTLQNKIDSQVVRQFAADNQLNLMQAKKMLEDKCGPVLQYCPPGGTNLDWTTIPHVTEYRNKQS